MNDTSWKEPEPRISLITGTVGRVEPLERLMTSLAASRLKPFQLIIIDQNDDDRVKKLSARFATDLPLTYVRTERGLSRARNVGLGIASGSIVAFPDDDCWYAPDLLAEVADVLRKRPKVDFLALRTVDADGRESVGRFLDAESRVTQTNAWKCCNSNGLFLRAGLCTELRFDEELGVGSGTPFGSGEETDFILTALSRGATGLFIPKPTVFHDQIPPDAPGPLGARSKKYAQGHAAVMVKHEYGILAIITTILRSFLSAVRYICQFNLRMARHKFFWTTGLIVGFARYTRRPVAASSAWAASDGTVPAPSGASDKNVKSSSTHR